ncbi:pyruvate kinase, partial [Candidatus Micrarchaeota archaeon]|nr:pyruvate kinase [Candidatus Micrarchaeota archaeon]
MRSTKIIATLGPACDKPHLIEGLVNAGVNVFRLNLSHGTQEEHLLRLKALDAAEKKTGRAFARLFDLQGPKIRVGRIDGGKVFLKEGDSIKLTGQKVLGNQKIISVDYPRFLDLVKKGGQVYIADGLIELKVTSVQKDYCVCVVEIGGFVGERKGVNVPKAKLDLSPLTLKDLVDAKFAVKQGADYVAQSFVRKASDVLELRKVLSDAGAPGTKIIAKIEDEEGVQNIDEIIAQANGIMVARGDLGVQIPLQDIPFVQKMIIQKTIEARKPVIVATQMLDSMTNNPTPTRAEVSDVANAIADGASAV